MQTKYSTLIVLILIIWTFWIIIQTVSSAVWSHFVHENINLVKMKICGLIFLPVKEFKSAKWDAFLS